jgi:hypothetical protein
LSKFTGGGASAVSVVVNDAVQDAPADEVAPVGVHVTAVPRFVEPFWNCTVPVGPCAELLFEEIVAVSVTDPPDVIELGLPTIAVVVGACVIVMVLVADVLPEKLLSPA